MTPKMTDAQLGDFRTRIESELSNLEQRTTAVRHELLQAASAQPTVVRNEIDHAKEEADINTMLELGERDLGLVARLRLALEKIKLGTYGDCELCEEPIDPRRLDAHPTAFLCIGCQAQAERVGAFQTPTRELPRSAFFDLTFGPARYGMA